MAKRKGKWAAVAAVILMSCPGSSFAQYQPNWDALDKRETPQWWKDAKFGIFIHWGVYSVPAYAPVHEVEGVYEKYAEHYANRLLSKNKLFMEHHVKYYGADFRYEDFVPMFKAEYFNPDQWTDLFERAGAKYVVLTSKHHDGFALWPSKESNGFNSVDLGPKRDLAGELTEAVRRKGMHMGFYYSLLEWDRPLYSAATLHQWVDTHMIPQMKDLVNRYRPEIIFSDGEWDYPSKDLKSESFLAWLYNDSPVRATVVVNDRWGKETRSKHGDYYTTEYDLVHDEKGIGDKKSHPWEESRGIGTSYGYNQFETAEDYFSSKQLIDLLIDKVSNGGNLLLNIGPKANGLIPVVMQERLLDMGKWLKVNGEAIYGTQAWVGAASSANKEIAFTQKGDTLYALVKKWPANGFYIDGLKNAGKVSLLGSNVSVKQKLKENRLHVEVAAADFSRLPPQDAWVFQIEAFQNAR
jgi:alpha-L-fucosidase